MTINTFEPYQLSSEYDVTEILSHFDADYIFDALKDKLDNVNFAASLMEPNFVASFEQNFKMMNEQFPGDSSNIQETREEVYTNIINMLCQRFNLEFNNIDPNIDKYTTAYYLYDFLICNRNNHMVNFFTYFIVNNKDQLARSLNQEDFRKNKDSSAAYGKRVYDDPKYAIISANMGTVINYIETLDISLTNIFQSSYPDPNLVAFLDNAIRDAGNYFKDFYCAALDDKEIAPIIITNIRLALQRIVGSPAATHMDEIITGENPASATE